MTRWWRPGWLCRLALRLDDPVLGLVGPATNRTCNEAQVESTYQTYEEFLRFAGERVRAHDGQVRPIRMLAMFCTAFRRSLYDEIGPLDERYAVGMFEDEDYALAAKSLGYGVAWAPDVYVHHAYHASIGKLLPAGTYLPLFRTNQQKFEHKWGICWERHRPPA
jgi:GT2 family glycosyltransferase